MEGGGKWGAREEPGRYSLRNARADALIAGSKAAAKVAYFRESRLPRRSTGYST